MHFAIERATADNARELAAVHIAAWQSAYRGIIPDDFLDSMPQQIEQRAEKFRQAIEEQQGFYYVPVVFSRNRKQNGKIIGKLVLWKSRDDDKPAAGEVGGIYLLEEFWDRGYGRAMMDFSIKILTDMGHTEILLWVLEDNTRARQFYEKCGFAFDGTKKEIVIGKPLVEIRYVLNM